MQNWKKELCSTQPKEFEMLNKHDCIQRRNITPYEKEGINGELEQGWECESRIMPLDEYNLLKTQEELKENQNIIMLALADIYEKTGGA